MCQLIYRSTTRSTGSDVIVTGKGAEEGVGLSEEVVDKLQVLVGVDTERVCVLAAILLCAVDRKSDQVSLSKTQQNYNMAHK